MAVERSLNMRFQNEKGNSYTLNIADAKEEIMEVDVAEQMDALLAENILTTKTGVVTKKVSANIVEKTITVYKANELA